MLCGIFLFNIIKMKVVMLGSGNAGTILCQLIEKSGHKVVQVVSRNEDHARELASSFNASTASLKSPGFADADIYIIALHDAALDHIENIPALKDKFVVHTAGSISINALKSCSDSYGVLYPLQSLSKFTDSIPEVPFLVDGNTPEVLHRVIGFAKSLSPNVIEADDTERLNYHVCAVFVNNFTNHLFAIAEKFCEKERIEFKNLLPLINETIQRTAKISPFLTQTGPAIRNDTFTLNRHLQALSKNPELKYLYLKLTESIMKFHGIK
jgi:predicted short-subunit dehydrogenase-like oxidoreductase (DUF2520 family)